MEIINTYRGLFKIVDDGYCRNAVSITDDNFFYCYDLGTPLEEIIDNINYEYECDQILEYKTQQL